MGARSDLMRRGIGEKMIAFAIKQALKIHEKVACRFITLDSKNDEEIPERLKPVRFYKKMGFEELKTREKRNTIYMCKDLINIIREEIIVFLLILLTFPTKVISFLPYPNTGFCISGILLGFLFCFWAPIRARSARTCIRLI